MLTNEEIDKLERGIRIAIQGGDSSHDLWPDGAAKLCAMARGMLRTSEIHAEQRQRVTDEIASVKAAMVPASEKVRVRDMEKALRREKAKVAELAALLRDLREETRDATFERDLLR